MRNVRGIIIERMRKWDKEDLRKNKGKRERERNKKMG